MAQRYAPLIGSTAWVGSWLRSVRTLPPQESLQPYAGVDGESVRSDPEIAGATATQVDFEFTDEDILDALSRASSDNVAVEDEPSEVEHAEPREAEHYTMHEEESELVEPPLVWRRRFAVRVDHVLHRRLAREPH